MNIEHPTSNAKHRIIPAIGHPSEFDVPCSMFDVSLF